MSKQSYRYPRDEFDDVPEDGPTGVHRVPRSAWHKVVPFVVVAVVCAVVAYAGVTLWSGSLGGSASADDGSGSVSTSKATSTKSAETSTGSSTGTSTSKATETGSATDGTIDGKADDSSASDDSADVDTSRAVAVKNGAKITGLAASAATKLKSAGFTSVTAGDYTGAALSDSVVYYVSDDDAATAKKVASTLGIDDVEQVSALKGGAPIIAVLVHALS